jgi:hypothetical protein
MILYLSVILLAVVLGYVFGGRTRRLEQLRLRWWGLVIVGLAIQFVPLPEGENGTDLLVRTAVLAVSYALLISFAAANLRLPGVWLVLLGLTCNVVVIVANGGMPVAREALERSGQADVIDLLLEQGADKHHLLTDDDVLTFLADVLWVPQPIGQAISIGDVFVYGGLIWLIVSAMRGRIPSTPTESEPYRGRHRRGTMEAPTAPVLPPPPAAMRWGTGP